MKLYLISQTINNDYDTYSCAVVAALSETNARMTHPDGRSVVRHQADQTWAGINDIKVTEIGEAAPGIEAGVICASFKGG